MVTTAAALERAIHLAKKATDTGPNPRVGAVLLRDGQIIGEGWHRGAGTPHAEWVAIEDAKARGNSPKGATLVVTLEPCKHDGRTPPCTDLIIASGIHEVVYACTDSGQQSSGGAEILKANGVKVEHFPSAEAAELIRIWNAAITNGRPYVTVKIAASLDGRVAAADGTSQWITGPESRDHAHLVRSQVGAIAVTTGTVFADDPALTARTSNGNLAATQPFRVIVGRRPIPETAKIWQSGTAAQGLAVQFQTHNIEKVLAELEKREVRHVLIEGGPALITACFKANVVDEIHAYLAPVVIGNGPTAVSDYGARTLSAAQRFTTQKVVQLGQDVLLIARKGAADFGAASQSL
ncbi:MAG: bifunctional diaminohydroxyphosphoribosylaminopyrimidine deaminase/5-amino-6-(5-phosphoribosylamino)uracil reductase RibD [Cellulomonadaceae bacterium]|jgi:diaminohydroxyphosphoribosylaminopyrimidine deaminase/5-amino-6-(5-phosphoribosylamino)uracil reductase|nr:bifunctional diaminohydroxyphosphoribosylaminopyrimidine deaminase/5-amino-6-(5-phosphoribosylamino)uracil reductase RibD [Cellulomonadaceae bacterium]